MAGPNLYGATATARGFISDITTYNALQDGTFAAALPGDVSSYKNQRRLVSFLGRVNYSFDNKYLLTASIRRDGSTVFGANHKWGNFPSISAGWEISKENFMSGVKAIDFLKLRGSYGKTGNYRGLGPYQARGLYAGAVYTTSTGLGLSQFPNDELHW